MVTTRSKASAMVSHAEEKKDEGDYSHYIAENRPRSQPQSTPTPIDNKAHESSLQMLQIQNTAPSSSAKAKKSPFLLLICATGITSCYLWYGTIQEHVFHMDNEESNEEEGEGSDDGGSQSITLFLLATSTFSSFLLAWIWTVIGPILLASDKTSAVASSNTTKEASNSNTGNKEGRLNHPLIVLTSLTYLSAMAASNESLHYVSYPTCVLAKSSKLIPTMIVGWIVDQWRSQRGNGNSSSSSHSHNTKGINAMEWIGAGLITIGILSFQYIQLHKQSNNTGSNHHGDNEEKPDSPYGLALLGFSLFMDGLLGACQSTLKQKNVAKDNTTTSSLNKGTTIPYRPPSAMETMLYLNLYATLILLPASHYIGGQLQRGMSILLSSSGTKSWLLLQLNLSASLGQVFIFLTIHHFSPLTCTTITTTRKFFTILLSVYKFGHVLNVGQWCSIGLVFGGLYLEIVAKLFEQKHHQKQENIIVEGDAEKRKVE